MIHDAQIRWNSSFLMIEQFNEQVEPLNASLTDRKGNKKHDNLVIDSYQKDMLNYAVEPLQPFYDATN